MNPIGQPPISIPVPPNNQHISFWRPYVLIILSLALVASILKSAVYDFFIKLANGGCADYKYFLREHLTNSQSCFHYWFPTYITPALWKATPFFVIALVIFVLERKKKYQYIYLQQEERAFKVIIFSIILQVLFTFFISGACHDGIGCVPIGLLAVGVYIVFGLIIFFYLLKFLEARYQNTRLARLLVIISAIALLYPFGIMFI